MDKARTGTVSSDGIGITVGLLHTGRIYPDDWSIDGLIYHYPVTKRPPGRDVAEVEATKAAGRLSLPVFVITHSPVATQRRDVYLGWVEAWDDGLRSFYVSFGDTPPVEVNPAEPSQGKPFDLFTPRGKTRKEVVVRQGQQRFRFRVLRYYGAQCAVCNLKLLDLLEAAHVGPSNLGGSDDPRNGIVLCANHHRAFDRRLFAIHPETLELALRGGGPSATDLGLVRNSVRHLSKHPHTEALTWAWRQRDTNA